MKKNPYKEKNLETLINLAQNDDKKAMDEIIFRYKNKVQNAFLSFDNSLDVSDLTQDTFFKVLNSIKTLKNPNSFNSWLFKIMNNIFCDFMRKNQKERLFFSQNIFQSLTEEFEDITLSEELINTLLREIVDLPPNYRSVIVLRDILEISYSDIASYLKISESAVKTRIYRARTLLRTKFLRYI